MDRRRRMEEGEKEEAAEKEARQTLSWGEALLWSCAQGAVWAFPGQQPLAPGPADHRGQCEAVLFGDVFSAGPVCLFSVFLAVDCLG